MLLTKVKEFIRLLKIARLYVRVGLRRMTPIKAYRMARYWILTTIFRKKIPWLIEFSVTYKCQCRCKHCSVSNYFDEARGKQEFSSEQIKDVLTQAVNMGIPKVDFFGGEPLIRKDIVDLVRFGESRGLYTSITTNAWALDKKMAKRLKKAGISCINISLDSVSEEEHDQLRGLSGVYKRAIDAFRYCHQEGIPCIASTYATRRRIKNFAAGESDDSSLTKIIALARNVKATAIRILFPIIAGEWVKKKEVELNEDEKQKVIESIDPSFAFIEGAYSVVKKKKVCQALSGKMFNISPYGDVQLCVAFPNTFGNLKEVGLRDLIEGMWKHPIYQKNKDGNCCSTNDLKQ